ncbi:hypothetical protein [Azotobacter beijerinckii]|uniref:hypothetical protein n=1 Tax=Azotobacter beijerinckii TaxID=170623 RepID=UPI002953404F|nr:hypothetical protein [Azotobacter beijerinckii]MDV7212338.1 hypothetical protein [Azotobacter beijerinckii]
MSEPALKAMRLELLKALGDRKYSTEDMNTVLAAAQDKAPSLFVPHEDLDDNAIDEDKLMWHQNDYRYYVKQKKSAEHNFSEARWQHLLAMRTYFRQKGYNGFAPQSSSESTTQPPKRNHNMPQYQPSENLKRTVQTGNVTAIRVALQHEMGNMRLSQQDLIDAANWVKKSKQEVFLPYEEKKFTRPIDLQHEAWDLNYHDSQVVSLENNFSKERFLHVLEVREHLRQRGEPRFIPPKDTPKAKTCTGNPDDSLSPPLKKILMIGGALAVLLALLLSLGK